MKSLNVILYTLFTYALTAVIAFSMIALIVFVNFLMNRKKNSNIDQVNSIEEVQ